MESSPTYPTLSLADDDRALLQRAAFAKFDLPSLIISDAHPAQRTLCSLVAWFDQPHIRAAADAIVAAFKRADAYATQLRQNELHKSIETLLAAALSLVTTQQSLDPAHNATAPAPDSPIAKAAAAATSRALATIREGRQLVSAALKAGLHAIAPQSSRAPRGKRAPNAAQHHSTIESTLQTQIDAHPQLAHSNHPDTAPDPLNQLGEALTLAQSGST
jgi:hypothetical protein